MLHLELLGLGYGYSASAKGSRSAVTRHWRRVKINGIGEGSGEINRRIIAKSLLPNESAEVAMERMAAQ